MSLVLEQNKFINILLPITYRCNLRCIFCSQYDNYGEHTSVKEIFRLIDSISLHKVDAITLYGGEPMLHPYFFEIGQYIKKKNLKSGFISNGTLINEANIDLILQSFDAGIISIHGFEVIHNSLTNSQSFQRTLKSIELLNFTEDFYLGINITVTKKNVHILKDFILYLYNKFPNIKTFILNRAVNDGIKVSKEILLTLDEYKLLEKQFRELEGIGIPVEIGIPSKELPNGLNIQACSWNNHFKP